MTLTATIIFILFQQQCDVETYLKEMFHCTSPVVTLKENMFQRLLNIETFFKKLLQRPNHVETFLIPSKFFVSTKKQTIYAKK